VVVYEQTHAQPFTNSNTITGPSMCYYDGHMHSHSQIQRPLLARTRSGCKSKQFIKAKFINNSICYYNGHMHIHLQIQRPLPALQCVITMDACTAIHKFKDHYRPKLVLAVSPNNLLKPSLSIIQCVITMDTCTAIHKFKDHYWPKLILAVSPNNLLKLWFKLSKYFAVSTK